MKKCLLLLENFEMGGAQNVVYELLRCIDRDCYDVNVLCYGDRVENTLTNKVEKIQTVEYLNASGRINLNTIRKVFVAIDKIKPDVIHAHLGGVPFGVLRSLFHNERVIVTAHTRPDQAFSSKILPLLRRQIKKGRVQVVAVSKENQKLLSLFWGMDEAMFPYVNNGINIQRFYRAEHELFTFINVGRQDENKNQIAILKAFEKLYRQTDKVRLILVGDGENHQMLIEETVKRGLSKVVMLPGNIGNVEDSYAISDCYVQASHREAMPLTALEAMAAGLPIVSTDVGGMRDIVKSNGYLVPDKDNEELYSAMKNIFNTTTEERQGFYQKSRELVESYSAEHMTQKYMTLYD